MRAIHRVHHDEFHRIRRRFPATAITTDVIVGFPGETERDFDHGLEFIRTMQFAKIHAFPYSSRPGTAAADMPGQISPTIQRQRMKRLLAVAADAEKEFQQHHLGKTLSVLWEGRRGGLWHGTSDNYLKVRTPSSRDLQRSLTPTIINGIDDDGVQGRPLLAA